MSRKAIYTKQSFFWMMTFLFSLPVVFNLYQFFISQNFSHLASSLLMGGLLYLIVSRNRFSKALIQTLFVIVILVCLIQGCFYLDSDPMNILNGILFFTITIMMATAILVLANKTIVVNNEKDTN